MKEVLGKLSKIQMELYAPKNQVNSYNDQNKYKYRNLEGILSALKPLLIKHNCLIRMLNDVEQVGDRFYVKGTIVLVDLESEQEVSHHAYAREPEARKGTDVAQLTGASSTYANKYALCGLFSISDGAEKDADETNKGDGSSDEIKSSQATKDAITAIRKCQTFAELQVIFGALKQEDYTEEDLLKIIKAKDEKKAELGV